MSQEALAEIRQFLLHLTERKGFQVLEELYSPDDFGNFLATLHSNDFGLQFLKDRGQFFLKIKSAKGLDDWHDLQTVLEFLHSHEPGSDTPWPHTLEQLTNSLEANYSALRDLFSTENYPSIRDSLRRFERAKAASMVAKLTGKRRST